MDEDWWACYVLATLKTTWGRHPSNLPGKYGDYLTRNSRISKGEQNTQLEDIKGNFTLDVLDQEENREVENRTEAGESRAQILEQVMKHVLKAPARHDGELMGQEEPGETILGCIMSQKMKRGGFVEKLRENLDSPPDTELHTERSPPSLPPLKDSDRWWSHFTLRNKILLKARLWRFSVTD